MRKLKLEDVKTAAEELNKLLFKAGDPQAINLKGKQGEIEEGIKEAAELLEPSDKLSDTTNDVLAGLGVEGYELIQPEETDEVVEPEPVVKKKDMVVTKGGRTGAPAKIPTPQELVEKAKTREELVNLCNTYTDLASLKTAHRKYKNDADLKAVMISLLDGEIQAETPTANAGKKAPVAAPKKGAEKVAKPKAAKTGTPSLASVVDAVLAKGGTWDEMVAAVKEECDARGSVIKYTQKSLLYRLNHLREKGSKTFMAAKITDKGISYK